MVQNIHAESDACPRFVNLSIHGIILKHTVYSELKAKETRGHGVQARGTAADLISSYMRPLQQLQPDPACPRRPLSTPLRVM